VICEEVKKAESRCEAASTLLGSERPFRQAHLLWQIFGLEGVEESNDDDEESNGGRRCPRETTEMRRSSAKMMKRALLDFGLFFGRTSGNLGNLVDSIIYVRG